MSRKFEYVPGKGFVPVKGYPGRMGVPKSSHAAAQKSAKMKLAWKMLKSGQASSMSEAMRAAGAQVYGSSYPSEVDFFPERRGVPHNPGARSKKSRVMKLAAKLRRQWMSKSRALREAYKRVY